MGLPHRSERKDEMQARETASVHPSMVLNYNIPLSYEVIPGN